MFYDFETEVVADEPETTTRFKAFPANPLKPEPHSAQASKPFNIEEAAWRLVRAGVPKEKVIDLALRAGGVPTPALQNTRRQKRLEALGVSVDEARTKLTDTIGLSTALCLLGVSLAALAGGCAIDALSVGPAFSRLENYVPIQVAMAGGVLAALVCSAHHAATADTRGKRVAWILLGGGVLLVISGIRGAYSSPWGGINLLELTPPSKSTLGNHWDFIAQSTLAGLSSLGALMLASAGLAGICIIWPKLQAWKTLKTKIKEMEREHSLEDHLVTQEAAIAKLAAESYDMAQARAEIAFYEAKAKIDAEPEDAA